MDITNNTNNDFKKLKNKISAYRDNVTKENQKNLRRDIKQLLEIVVLERELTLIIDNIALLILSVTVSTENFIVEELIEKIYKYVYKNLVEKKNYLGSNSTENPLISYLTVPIRRKDKNRLSPVSSSLIVSKGSKNSVSPYYPNIISK